MTDQDIKQIWDDLYSPIRGVCLEDFIKRTEFKPLYWWEFGDGDIITVGLMQNAWYYIIASWGWRQNCINEHGHLDFNAKEIK